MSVEHREAVVKRYIEGLANRDLAAIASIYAEDARSRIRSARRPSSGSRRSSSSTDVRLSSDPFRRADGSGSLSGECGRLFLSGDLPERRGRTIPAFTDIIDVFEFDGEGRVVSMKAYWTPF